MLSIEKQNIVSITAVLKSLNFTIVYRVMQSKNIIQDIKKCGPAVFRITTGTAKRLIEIQINKQSAPLQVYEQYFFIPFSTMTFAAEAGQVKQNWRFCRKRESEDSGTVFSLLRLCLQSLPKVKNSARKCKGADWICFEYMSFFTVFLV